jgi:hypothetical protein
VSARSAEVAAPAPAPKTADSLAPEARKLQAGLAEQPAADALSENLAVQGEDSDGSERKAEQPKAEQKAEPSKAEQPKSEQPKTAARAAENPAAASAGGSKPAASAAVQADAPKQSAAASDNDDKPAPTLPPHEGLPARPKGGRKKKNG